MGNDHDIRFGAERSSNGSRSRDTVPGKRSLTDGMSQMAAGAASGAVGTQVEIGRAPIFGEQFGKIRQPATEAAGVPTAVEGALNGVFGALDDFDNEGLQQLEEFVKRTGFSGTPITNSLRLRLAFTTKEGRGQFANESRVTFNGTARLRLAQIAGTGRKQAMNTGAVNNANSGTGSSSTSTTEATATMGSPPLPFGGSLKRTNSETETSSEGSGSGGSTSRSAEAEEKVCFSFLVIDGTAEVEDRMNLGVGGGRGMGERRIAVHLPPICLGQLSLWSES